MRHELSLNGLWHFAAAPLGNSKPTVRDWMPVRVPACWNTYAPHLAQYEGCAWFRREFEPPPGTCWRLCFQGVNYKCEVFVNDRLAGGHEGGYTPFALDVTPWIRPGVTNVLCVKVDNARPAMRVPPAVHGWFNYGGIYRDVSIIGHEGLLIENARVDAAPMNLRQGAADYALVHVRPAWAGSMPRGGRWRVTLRRAGQAAAPLATVVFRRRPPAMRLEKPALWSPENPALYQAEIELVTPTGVADRSIQTFGVRQVEFRRTGFFLNGQKVFLRGVNRHDDYPTTKRTVDADVLDLDLRRLKELGVNALRLAHYPHDPRVLAECDRRGFLVWAETPVYWKVDLHSRAVRTLAVQMAQEMVRRDWNHPCVAFWGLYNEIDSELPAARPLVRAVARAVRALDSTRLVTAASSRLTAGPGGDVCRDLLDAVGLNTYPAWHGTAGVQARQTAAGLKIKPLDLAHFHVTLRAVRRRLRGRAFLLSEFGAEGILGFRAADLPKYSEDYQAHALIRQFAVIRQYPEIAGVFVWLFADFPDPSRRESCFHVDFNCKGLVDYGRRKKMAFEELRKIYAEWK